jgi:hypothetical protein
MPECPPDLLNHYRTGRLIPFLGAGVSASVSWTADGCEKHPPTWNELVNHAAEALGFSDPDLLRVRGNDLQILEYYDLVKGGRDELGDWLVEAVRAPDEALTESVIHQALAGCTKVPLIYTTNYDPLIERALELHGRPAVMLARERDFPRALEAAIEEPNTCQVIKFHGDLSARETMVLTEGDYEKRLKLEDEMDLRLRSDLLGRAVLFLGYSFSDANVSYIFELVKEAFQELPESDYGRRAFITVADPSQFERRLFKRRGIDVISIDSARQADEIAELLRILQHDG